MRKNVTLNALLSMQEMNVKALERISVGIEAINDGNILHRNILEKNSDAICLMNTNIKATVSLLKWIVMALVLALIVLAGAEKALKFL